MQLATAEIAGFTGMDSLVDVDITAAAQISGLIPIACFTR